MAQLLHCINSFLLFLGLPAGAVATTGTGGGGGGGGSRMGCIAAMGGRGAKAAGGPDALCGAIRGGKAGSGGASTCNKIRKRTETALEASHPKNSTCRISRMHKFYEDQKRSKVMFCNVSKKHLRPKPVVSWFHASFPGPAKFQQTRRCQCALRIESHGLWRQVFFHELTGCSVPPASPQNLQESHRAQSNDISIQGAASFFSPSRCESSL